MSDCDFPKPRGVVDVKQVDIGPCHVLIPWTEALAPSHAMCGVNVFDPGASIPL